MNKKLTRKISDYILIITGTVFIAVSVSLFQTPAKLAPGGILSIATIVYHTLGLDTGLTYFALSVPIFILSLKLFGKIYTLRTLFPILLLSGCTSLCNMIFGYDGILDYARDLSVLLSCLYGGVLSGIGIGLVMKGGSNTGGTDTIGLALSRFTHIPVGTAILAIDSIIIISSAFIFGIEKAMLGVVFTYIVSVVLNKTLLSFGASNAKTIYIISNNLEEIGNFITVKLNKGGTLIPAKGLYSKDAKEMLMTVIPNHQVSQLVRFIHDTDSNAFLIIENANQVFGEGFMPINDFVEKQKNDVTQKNLQQ